MCVEENADLIIIQRGVVTQGTDGSQLNQSIILATFHWKTTFSSAKCECFFKVSVRIQLLFCLYSHDLKLVPPLLVLLIFWG